MRQLFSILILTILFSGCFRSRCNEDNNSVLTEAEKSSIPYTAGQQLIFRSNTGINDTVLVHEIYYDPGEEDSRDPCDDGAEYLWGTLKYFPGDSTNYNGVYCSFKLLHKGLINLHFYSPSTKFVVQGPPQNNIMINGSAYNNVYIISKDITSCSNETPCKVYYTYQKGIIRVDYKSGNYWERIN